jgi:DNA-binding response OmpR family regulator
MARKIFINRKEFYIERNTIRIVGTKIFADGKVLMEDLEGDVLIRSADGDPVNILADRIVILPASPCALRMVIEINGMIIDPNNYTVFREDKEISLCKKEFEMLYLLASNPKRVYTRDEIINNIWGRSVIVVNRTVDVHARRIRSKAGNDLLSTVKGVGYKFE